MADSPDLPWEGWRQAYLPIHVGNMPPGGVSLRRLGERDGLASTVDRIAVRFAADRLYAALTALHYAIGAAAQLLIAPFAVDGVLIDVSPDSFGIVIDTSATLTAQWVQADQISIATKVPAHLGRQLIAGLAPIGAAVSELTGTPNRAITLVMIDAIERACRRLERANACRPECDWVDAVLTAIGDPDHPTRRTFTVTPDAGPAIEMRIPRVCCVLATAPGADACPTCPQRSPDDRRSTTEAWLRSLNETGFLAESGRRRVVPDHPPTHARDDASAARP